MDGDQIFSGVVRSVKCGQSLKGPCLYFLAILGTLWYYIDTKFGTISYIFDTINYCDTN